MLTSWFEEIRMKKDGNFDEYTLVEGSFFSIGLLLPWPKGPKQTNVPSTQLKDYMKGPSPIGPMAIKRPTTYQQYITRRMGFTCHI
jgi:hypothetical protein